MSETKLTVILMRKTFVECSALGDKTKLSGQRTTKANRLKGG